MLLLLLTRALANDVVAATEVVEPPPWVVDAARVRVVVHGEDDATVDVEYRYRRLAKGWAELPVVGPQVVPDVVEGPVSRGPGGVYAVLPPEGATAVVRVRGALNARGGAASLALLPSARATLTVDAPGYDVVSTGAIGGVVGTTGQLALSWRPHVERAPTRPSAVVLGESSVAGWESEGALQVQAKVRWRVARGELPTLRVQVGGLDELDVTGAVVGGWRRVGDVVEITPVAPVTGAAEVLVRGRVALPATGSVTLPAVGPADARRVERYWTLGRPEEIDVIPTSTARLTSPRTLPPWARGLSEAPPIAAWQGDGPVTLQLARYEPLMGPDTVVETAEFVLATSAEGREMLRSTWLVRNERSQYLHVRPSPGYRPLTARVSGDPVSVLADGQGGLYVPLEKSVETMQGLVSFPVEVTWIADTAAWARRGEHAFVLPAVDAPIQALAWTIHLPRDVERLADRGESGGVRRGGRGAGGGGRLGFGKMEPPDEPEPVVDLESQDAGREAWLNALDSYKDNEFDAAERWLDVARSYVPDDDNVARLQSNLDVLLDGRDQPASGEDAQARRIRDLANAKTVSQQVEVEEVERKAEEALRAGDDEAASQYLQRVVEIAEKVAVTEQRENTEQRAKADKAKKALSSVKERQSEAQDQRATSFQSFEVSGSSGDDGEALGALGYVEGGIEGGIEGGVVGGVIGGVLGGASGGVATSEGRSLGITGTGTGGGGSAEGWVVEEEPVAEPTVEYRPDIDVDYDAIVDDVDALVDEPVAASPDAASPAAEGQTLSAEFLSRIPTGRSYQSVSQAAAGVARGGRGRAGGGKGGSMGAGSTVTNTATTSESSTRASGSPKLAPPPAASAAPAQMDWNADAATEPDLPSGLLQFDLGESTPPEAQAEIRDLYDDPAPPPAPPARAALVVTASPFTPALPLDGPLVRHDSALLPAGAHPTFTVPYRSRGN